MSKNYHDSFKKKKKNSQFIPCHIYCASNPHPSDWWLLAASRPPTGLSDPAFLVNSRQLCGAQGAAWGRDSLCETQRKRQKRCNTMALHVVLGMANFVKIKLFTIFSNKGMDQSSQSLLKFLKYLNPKERQSHLNFSQKL